MKRFFLTLSTLFMLMNMCYAQQAIFERRDNSSPKFNEDGTVTLNLRAPEAQKVFVAGDCRSKKVRQLATATADGATAATAAVEYINADS